MNARLVSSAALAILLCFLHTGEAQEEVEKKGRDLKCYQCSSYDDAQCTDPFLEDSQQRSTKAEMDTKFLKPCENDQATFCRKIYQNVRGDERIIRSCGWELYKDVKEPNCYKTVLEEYNTYVCQCFGEGCNGSSMLSVSVMAMLSAVFLAALVH